jgi:RNA-directed DNA polymerase
MDDFEKEAVAAIADLGTEPEAREHDERDPHLVDRFPVAAKLVLEPIFEADLEGNAYGYRPRRSATNGIKEVHWLICRGYTDVVDADLAHGDLMQSVARRTVDRDVLHLIKMWLTVPVEEQGARQ